MTDTNAFKRREVWTDSSNGKVFLSTTWIGNPGYELENLICVYILETREKGIFTYVDKYLYHDLARSYYESLLKSARRIG